MSDYPIKQHPKRRVNMSIDDRLLDAMTDVARDLGCSRSSLVEYCFRVWCTQNGYVDRLYSAGRGNHVS